MEKYSIPLSIITLRNRLKLLLVRRQRIHGHLQTPQPVDNRGTLHYQDQSMPGILDGLLCFHLCLIQGLQYIPCQLLALQKQLLQF